MSTPLIVQHLKAGSTLQSLVEQYHLTAKPHPVYPNLIQLKYDQIKSPMDERLVQECRGLIIDLDNHAEVVARPFDKFFNYGEPLATEIDWNTAKVQEKLDGSLMILYNYDAMWHVATSGTPDAGGLVDDRPFTFSDLFWKVFEEKSYKLPPPTSSSITFMFELTTPFNRIVVNHKGNDLKLIGIRYIFSGNEFPVGNVLSFEPVKEFNLRTMKSVQNSFLEFDPLDQEGYVVVDHNFNRIKVKHPRYVALHHLRSGWSQRRLIELIRSGETDEVVASFPEWGGEVSAAKRSYANLADEIKGIWEAHHDVESQKDFALAIKHLPYSGVLFALRNGHITSVEDGLSKTHIDHLVEWVKMFT